MNSFTKKAINNLHIPHSIIGMIRALGEYKGRQELFKKQSPEMLENLRRIAIVQSIESSNRLEGITAGKTRLKKILEEKTPPKNRSESEIAGYRDVLGFVHSNIDKIHLTERVVLQFHGEMMKYSGKEGGRWKSVPNEIIEKAPDGSAKVRFTPVSPVKTYDYMRQLHSRYHHISKHGNLDPLLTIPLYILDFLCIHPFLDGNGRLSRILTVLLLHKNGYEVSRFISIERIIENSKESYYETLYKSSLRWHNSEHDLIPWIDYFLSTLLAAYNEFEKRVGNISTGQGSKMEMVASTIDSFIGEFSLAELEEACPMVGRDWIRKLLQRLKSEGKIASTGKGRYARWKKV